MHKRDQKPGKYCAPIIFARFVCSLLGSCARDFPAKSENNPGHLLFNKGRKYDVDARVLSVIIAQNNDKKLRVNK